MTGPEAPDADEVVARDHGRLLWNLALAGAQLRRAEQVATPGPNAGWDPDRLDLGGPPRAVLVATDAPTAGIADLLTTLAAPVAPVTVLGTPQLPRWAGASDAVVITSLDGRHPRLVALADQAARRGCAVLAVAPVASPLGAAAARGAVADLAADTAVRGAFFSAVGPVLVAAGRWGLTAIGPRLLTEAAEALDDVAHRCRPSSDAVANPARALAEAFTEAVPVVVGAGPLAAVAARAFAAALRVSGGRPALAARLPDEIAQVTALLVPTPGTDDDDFFRDRVEDPGARPQVLLVGSEGSPDDPELGRHDGSVEHEASEREALEAARVVERAAQAGGVRVSTLDVPRGDPLVRCLAAVHLGAFTGAYLGLLRDVDPSAPRAGELL